MRIARYRTETPRPICLVTLRVNDRYRDFAPWYQLMLFSQKTQTRGTNKKFYNNRNNPHNTRPTRGQPQGRGSNLGTCNQGSKPHNGNRPQCQLYGKYDHIAPSCYHRFDVNFQGGHLPPSTYNNSASSSHNNDHVQAMLASPSIPTRFLVSWYWGNPSSNQQCKPPT